MKKTQIGLTLDVLNYLNNLEPGRLANVDELSQSSFDLTLMSNLVRESLVESDSHGQTYKITREGKLFLIQYRVNQNLEQSGKLNERMEIYTLILIGLAILSFVSSFLAIGTPTTIPQLIAYLLLFITTIITFWFIFRKLKQAKELK